MSSAQNFRVLVIGATGMLGSMVLDVLDHDPEIAVYATGREPDLIERGSVLFPRVSWHPLLLTSTESNLKKLDLLPQVDWIVNAAVVSDQRIAKGSLLDREKAVFINTIFPYEVARHASNKGVRVIQLASERVFSGSDNPYREADPHDNLSIFGKTMSLGEVPLSHTYVLRSSIVGPEPRSSNYLLETILGVPKEGIIECPKGLRWNGITSYHYAKICQAIIKNSPSFYGIEHLVPADILTIKDFIEKVASIFGRDDITVKEVENLPEWGKQPLLATSYPERNSELWYLAGYEQGPPTIEQMLVDLRGFKKKAWRAA